MKPRVFLPAIVSGLLLWAAFFPLNLGPLAYVALVPWLTLVRAPVANRRRYFAAYIGGVAFFLPALQWVRVAHPMMHISWIGLALVCPLFWVIGLSLIRRIDRLGVPLAVSVPAVWVALEYTRAHFPTGFPVLQHVGLYQMIGFGWYFLGYTQHEFLPLIQIADLGGVYAVSFLVAAVNGVVCEWALRSNAVRGWLRTGEPGDGSPPEKAKATPLLSSITVGLLYAAAVGYGFVRLDHPAFEPGPRVAAIQGSVPQFEKVQKGQSLGQTYAELHRRAAAANPRPDLIVWPETCFPYDWKARVPGSAVPDEVRAKVEECEGVFASGQWGAATLIGLSCVEWEDGRLWQYNSALLLSPEGRERGRYDKMHLVPFGEYVPLKETFPWMQTFTPYKWDYSCRPGEHWTRFPLTSADGRAFTFGCLICYEDSDPYLARQYVSANPVDFLVNISNDGWFDGTEEHEQHLAICRFRAVETRRSIVRAVNMGISGVIDPDGRVIAIPGESWSASKKVEAVVTAVVPIDGRESWYARLGDWVPALCGIFIVIAVAVGVRRRSSTNSTTV